MLDQAKELQSAIENYHENPWKGCKVRNRTLTLKDDIRDNFGRFAQGLSGIAKCLQPLVDENLLAADITSPKLSAIIKHIDGCMDVPVIPSDWFRDPRAVSKLFLEREQIWQEIDGFRLQLSNYVDDVSDIFSPDLVTLGNWDSYFWLGRLQTKLPDDYRESEQQLLGHSSSLNGFAEELDSLQLSLKNLISETKLPIKSNVMIGSIPRLAALARLITEVYPCQKDWFNSQRSGELRLAAQQAISELDSASKIDGPSVEKLLHENLVKLVQTNPDPTSLRVSWNELQTLFQCRTMADVTQCLLSVAELTEPMRAVQQHFKALATCLQLDSGFLPSVISLSNVADGFAAHGRVTEFHGNWTSSSVRKQLRLGADSALSDIQEATEIRESLETRLSHRAFLPAARSLADRGVKYESFWCRTFGGFKAFLNQLKLSKGMSKQMKGWPPQKNPQK